MKEAQPENDRSRYRSTPKEQSAHRPNSSHMRTSVSRGTDGTSALQQPEHNKTNGGAKSTRYGIYHIATSSSLIQHNVRFAELDSYGLALTSAAEATEPVAPHVDDNAAVEERRKRRAAILAKHRETPLLVQVLGNGNSPGSTSPQQSVSTPHSEGSGKLLPLTRKSEIDAYRLGSPPTAPNTPGDDSHHGSPPTFTITDDAQLANSNTAQNDTLEDDEPSAADYDPTMDMQEDRDRSYKKRSEDVSASQYDETLPAKQDVLMPDSLVETIEKPSTKPVQLSDDMFASDNDDEDDDMFAPAAAKRTTAVALPKAKELDMSLMDNWDDHEGYYRLILGEILDGSYQVQASLGKGMFSSVVRCKDNATGQLKAIKIIRNNEMMMKAGTKEMDILHKLMNADPDDKKHMIRLERSFTHKGHLCMVFENLSINLREVLKKFGRDCGINLKAVRAYAQQMFLGLSLLRKCNIIHADLKPDNVLVNEERNMLKICDLGSASDSEENDITPYLVSRFYRAPEVMLGVPYDFGIDMWSIGCTLFELYTGKILFTGRNNNQMLRSIIECRGKFTLKMLKKAEFGAVHFDDSLNFRSMEKDKVTGREITRLINYQKPTRDLKTRIMAGAGRGDGKGLPDADLKELNLFVDLLDRCLNLNPEKRIGPAEALKHPFIHRGPGK